MTEGHFVTLEPEECVRLLHEARIGRLAFHGPDGPTVVPLTYVVDGGRVLVRTGPGTQLAAVPEGTVVAFEVDDHDDEYSNGWSVLVRGPLTRMVEGTAPGRSPQPFVPGARPALLAVALDRVSGRAVSATS